MDPKYERTAHLVQQVADAERLADRLAGAPGAADPAAAIDAAAVASCRLDGSRLADVPDRDVDPDAPPATPGPEDADPTEYWVDPMGFVHESDDDLAALEFAGVRAALASDDLAPRLFDDPVPALAELHRRLTRGLLEPQYAGTPRTTIQVVHDASVGRLLYYPAEPEALPQRLAALGAWMVSKGAREHALVASGILHLDLLDTHPFEAANGRLARAAARLVLRARGLDPAGRAAVEVVLAEDPLGYLEEVAKTRRRRDVTIWLERWSEAVVESLRRAARAAGVLDTTAPDRAAAFVAGDGPDTFTVADYREVVGLDTEAARRDLAALLDTGDVRLVAGARGLRYRRA